MNSVVNVAETSACVFDIEIVKSVVPPALMVLGEKLFEIVGLAGPTVSVSADVQVWFMHEGEELVLVTLSGGDITAVFVTWVWACTPNALKKHKNNKAPSATTSWNRKTERAKKKKEQGALNECKEVTF